MNPRLGFEGFSVKLGHDPFNFRSLVLPNIFLKVGFKSKSIHITKQQTYFSGTWLKQSIHKLFWHCLFMYKSYIFDFGFVLFCFWLLHLIIEQQKRNFEEYISEKLWKLSYASKRKFGSWFTRVTLLWIPPVI